MTVDSPTAARTATLLELNADAEYAEWRAELYRAKPYGPRIRPARRLRKLEQTSRRAEAALASAEAEEATS